MSCSVQEGVVIADRGESQSVMLCLGERGDSGQGRVTVTNCHVVFRSGQPRCWGE